MITLKIFIELFEDFNGFIRGFLLIYSRILMDFLRRRFFIYYSINLIPPGKSTPQARAEPPRTPPHFSNIPSPSGCFYWEKTQFLRTKSLILPRSSSLQRLHPQVVGSIQPRQHLQRGAGEAGLGAAALAHQQHHPRRLRGPAPAARRRQRGLRQPPAGAGRGQTAPGAPPPAGPGASRHFWNPGRFVL